jgi:aryl-alcohol dehydrogenase-like predicted oxidoreductase
MLWEGCAALNGEENKPAFEWYKENRMPVFAWSSLGSGFMSGRITRESYEANPDAFDPCFRRAFCHEENFQRLDRARQMAEEKGVTLPQLALAYVLSQPLDIHALVGAAKEEEIRENLHAFELDLSEEERAWLNLERETKP